MEAPAVELLSSGRVPGCADQLAGQLEVEKEASFSFSVLGTAQLFNIYSTSNYELNEDKNCDTCNQRMSL